MKALPKRKGNTRSVPPQLKLITRLNESPSQKEGKYRLQAFDEDWAAGLNESPSEKEGKCRLRPSVLQKRNRPNESPSKEEGKYDVLRSADRELGD